MSGSNVMYDGHGVDSLGDMHQYGNINTEKKDTKKENIANSADYHFHSTIQHLEDGLQEQWKEQNRNMNKNRSNPVSSMTDAKFRKLITSMMFPVSYNMVCIAAMFFITPLFFAFRTHGHIAKLIGVAFMIILIANVFFDAFVIYRAKKYVIEKVTNKYYKVLRGSWRSFEILTIMLSIGIFIIAGFFYSHPELTSSIKAVNKIIGFFDLENYAVYSIGIVAFYFVAYYLFVSKIEKEAEIKQHESIKEARSSSEHNADVAQSILDGSLGDFEDD